jgi:hypothetical protein
VGKALRIAMMKINLLGASSWERHELLGFDAAGNDWRPRSRVRRICGIRPTKPPSVLLGCTSGALLLRQRYLICAVPVIPWLVLL